MPNNTKTRPLCGTECPNKLKTPIIKLLMKINAAER